MLRGILTGIPRLSIHFMLDCVSLRLTGYTGRNRFSIEFVISLGRKEAPLSVFVQGGTILMHMGIQLRELLRKRVTSANSWGVYL